jgi:hypothetical protein
MNKPPKHHLLTAAILSCLVASVSMAQEEPEDHGHPVAQESPTQTATVRLDGQAVAERGAALVRYVATCKPKPADETYPKAAAPAYAARLLLNVDTNYALLKLDAAVTSRIAKAKKARAFRPHAGSDVAASQRSLHGPVESGRRSH